METSITRSILFGILIVASCATAAQTKNAGKGATRTGYNRTVEVPADSSLRPKGLRKVLIGENYRKEWTQPITVPIFDFNVNGGMEIKKPGGGKETKSLHLETADGKEWALRSVEKFPENAMPPLLRNTAAEKLFKDGISASYPYGALSMGVLSNAAHVPYLKEKLVYLRYDTSLEKYKINQGLTMWLEQGSPAGLPNDVRETKPAEKQKQTLSTQEVVNELQQKGNITVDQLSVLRARLLDNFVMDFDRHEEQWEWIPVEGAAGSFYAVPKDRDLVFYKGNGILMKVLASKSLVPQLQGFRAQAKNITTFNKSAQNFDRFFLNELTESDWRNAIDQFLHGMTDAVIDDALLKQPPEIQKYSAEKIAQTLKERRKYFKDEMMRYYRFLSTTVTIVGSNDRDQFTVYNNDDGTVTIQRREFSNSHTGPTIMYNRTFEPTTTKEIRIYGLEGDDQFLIKGPKSKIKIRVVGGPGNDEFANYGDARNVYVYDVSFEQNFFSGVDNFKKVISKDPQNNTYTRLGYRYNSIAPTLAIEYSYDGGLLIGPKLKITTQGFRKDPYASRQVFFITRRIGASAYHVKYNGDFTKVFGNTDLVVQADSYLPTTRTLFFGLGNNTAFDKSRPGGDKNYLVQYNIANVSIAAQNTVNSWLRFRYGPIFQYFKADASKNQNNQPLMMYHANNKSIDTARFYAGLGAAMQINTKNDELIPMRGVDLNVYGKSLAGLTGNSHSVFETGGQLSLFTDFISRNHLVVSTSLGASKIFGNYQFEQAQYLGFKQNLRGYRFNRFAGRSRAYNNTEIRWSFGNDVNLGLFRGSVGLLAFNDVGRVWVENEDSKKWHDGYGWGIWLAPLNRLVIVGSLTYSDEERNLPMVTFHFQF